MSSLIAVKKPKCHLVVISALRIVKNLRFLQAGSIDANQSDLVTYVIRHIFLHCSSYVQSGQDIWSYVCTYKGNECKLKGCNYNMEIFTSLLLRGYSQTTNAYSGSMPFPLKVAPTNGNGVKYERSNFYLQNFSHFKLTKWLLYNHVFSLFQICAIKIYQRRC